MNRPILCAVTDRRRLAVDDAGDANVIVAQARDAADAGIDLFQIREPDLPDRVLFELTQRVLAAVAAAGSGTRVLVNDRLDVALAAGAHGVHLRGQSFSAARARAITGARASAASFLIGRSVHSVEEAVAAEAAGGLDYLILGAMFPTSSKPADHPLAGIETLRAAVQACRRLPILAIGGITLENAEQIARAGAAGLAAIGLFLGPRQPAAGPARSRNLRARAAQLRQFFAA
jgi:thiamine-phosphate diphosphorylase